MRVRSLNAHMNLVHEGATFLLVPGIWTEVPDALSESCQRNTNIEVGSATQASAPDAEDESEGSGRRRRRTPRRATTEEPSTDGE